jgi:hypothetical protein
MKSCKKSKGEEKSSEVTLRCTEDFRPGEAQDFIINAIEHYLKSLPEKHSRRRTVGESIIKMNEKSDYEEVLSKKLDEVFKDRRYIRKELSNLGFKLKRPNKHHCFGWADQTVTVSSSPSDCRSSKNEVNNIKNKIYVG